MPDMMIHDIPDEAHAALETRATRNGRTPEDEVRALILAAAAEPPPRNPADLIAEFHRRTGGIELHIDRDKTPAGNILFE